MFFAIPLRDEPNPPGRPIVTWALIAANVAVYLLFTLPLHQTPVSPDDPRLRVYVELLSREGRLPWQELLRHVTAYNLFTFDWGFRPAAFSITTLFTSMFLHGGFTHLAGNMLFLWIYGDNVEHHLGRARFLAFYLVTGALGTLTFALFQLGSHTPLVGASGAISGVLGAYYVAFPRNRVRVLTVFFWIVRVIYLPARWVLGFYLLAENLLPLLLANRMTAVAYGAHIGGFVSGAAAIWLLERLGPLWRVEKRRAPTASQGTTFSQAIERGELDSALTAFAAMSPTDRQRLAADDVFALADALHESGEPMAALALLQRFMVARPRDPRLAGAHLRAGQVLLRGLGRPAAAYQHLLTVLDLSPTASEAAAARAALLEIA